MPPARLAQPGLLGLVLVLFCGVGAAAERPRDKKAALHAEAARLLQSGQQALLARDFATAERALTESYVKVAAPQPLYFLALAAAQQGRVLEAQDLLHRFEADAAAEPDAATVTELRRLLAQPTPPHGKVQVLGEPGAIVRVDGRLIGALPLVTPALVLPDQPHSLTLETRGRSIPATVAVAAGRFVEVRVNADTRAALITLLPAYIALVRTRGPAGSGAPLPPELPARLGRALEEGLQAEKRSLLGRELSLLRAPELARCLERLDCQQKLAEKNDAEGVFQIDVEPGAGAGRYRVRVKLLDTATGDVAAESESDSSEDELIPALQKAVVGAATRVSQRPRGTLSVLTEPPGAEVFIDDKPLGRAPLERVVWAGTHALVLRKPGHQDVRRPLELGDGQSVTVRESLPPRAAEPVPPPSSVLLREAARGRRPLWRLVVGPLAIGGGLLLSGIAVHGATLPGKCAGTDQFPDPAAPCSQIYSGAVAGSANSLLGLGLLITGAGIGLVAWPGPRIDVYGVAPR
ncbi:MAG: PEGA domain-containing protein [Polyangia bacterium]